MEHPPRPSPWYGSFFWRIGISFVVFLLLVLTAQSIMFSYMIRARLARLQPDGRRARGAR